MGIRIYTSTSKGSAVPSGCLVIAADCTIQPPHPQGGEWTLLAEIFEDPDRIIASRRHLAQLNKYGWIISTSPPEKLIKPRK